MSLFDTPTDSSEILESTSTYMVLLNVNRRRGPDSTLKPALTRSARVWKDSVLSIRKVRVFFLSRTTVTLIDAEEYAIARYKQWHKAWTPTAVLVLLSCLLRQLMPDVAACREVEKRLYETQRRLANRRLSTDIVPREDYYSEICRFSWAITRVVTTLRAKATGSTNRRLSCRD